MTRVSHLATLALGLLLPFSACATPDNTTVTGNNGSASEPSPSAIPFPDAVALEAALASEFFQLATTPAIPLPPNLTHYDVLSRVVNDVPIVQTVAASPNVSSDVVDTLIALTSGDSSTDDTTSTNATEKRQSKLRVMIVGDSMSQGQEGDFTWRYRILQWFQTNNVNVDMVGPYTGTFVGVQPAAPPQPPPLYNSQPSTTSSISVNGGYAKAAGTFDSDHFANWGRAAAVEQGLIYDVTSKNPTDVMLLMLGFNDLGWFYSDAYGLLNSIYSLIQNARKANPNMKFAVANVPQRSFIGGRQDLVDNTNLYNSKLPQAISGWTTTQSPVYLVKLAETYSCTPSDCPAGYDGLHPNEFGEYQIASAFSQTLYSNFGLGKGPLAVPAQSSIPARDLPTPSNFQLVSSPQGVTATWTPVYGAYSYDVYSSINGGSLWDFSAGSVNMPRWDSTWPLDGWSYAVSIRASAGTRKSGNTTTLTATSHPQLAPGPNNVVVSPTDTGMDVSWDPPTGPYTDSIVEYNILYWDMDSCNFVTGAAFKSSPAHIDGLVSGHHHFVALITWNANGAGFPEIVNNVIPGYGVPSAPQSINVVSTDATSVYINWAGISGAAGYTVWVRNVNNASSVSSPGGNTQGPCFVDFFLFPGVWNYEFCVSSFNGNNLSPKGACVVAPSPTSSSGASPTCPPGPGWCPNGPSAINNPVPTETGTIPGGGGGTATTIPTSNPTSSNSPSGSNSPWPFVTNGQCQGPDCKGGKCTGILCASLGCTGSDCSGGTCHGPACTVGACIGSGCTNGVCSGSGCSSSGCIGSQCGGGGGCFGLDCISIGCVGPDCHNGVCSGPNCSETSCTGSNCANGVCSGSGCTIEGSDTGGQFTGNPTASASSSCATPRTVSNCRVNCNLQQTAAGSTLYTSCYSTACSNTLTGCNARGTTTTLQTTIQCPNPPPTETNPNATPVPTHKATTYTGIKTTSPKTTRTTQPTTAPATPTPYIMEVFNRNIVVGGEHGGAVDSWSWVGLVLGSQDQNADICRVSSVFQTNYNHDKPTPTYPASVPTFGLTNHPTCTYTGGNTATVGSVTCNDGYRANCTPYPSATQTQAIECSSEERDDWYRNFYCYYS